MVMSNEEYRKNTKFIVDVSDLDADAKLAVWKHFWDFGKTKDQDFSVFNFTISDNYFSVFSHSDFRGNISRSQEHPAKIYTDDRRTRTFKPILETETVYRVKGLDMPEEIVVEGIRYRRVT